MHNELLPLPKPVSPVLHVPLLPLPIMVRGADLSPVPVLAVPAVALVPPVPALLLSVLPP
eukprot:14861304-Heterocapsa_arctica.AAC.1